MRRKKCPREECYDGKVVNWDYREEDWKTCLVCGGAGVVDDVEAEAARFKSREVFEQAQGFLKAIDQNAYDQDARLVYSDWLEEQGELDEANYQRAWTAERQEAEDYLDDYALQCAITREELIESAVNFLEKGEWLCIGTDTPDIVWRSDMFWRHFKALTGRELPENFEEDRGNHFIRCAC
jgi:uncharacterized protein (TIGR02996 family)